MVFLDVCIYIYITDIKHLM